MQDDALALQRSTLEELKNKTSSPINDHSKHCPPFALRGVGDLFLRENARMLTDLKPEGVVLLEGFQAEVIILHSLCLCMRQKEATTSWGTFGGFRKLWHQAMCSLPVLLRRTLDCTFFPCRCHSGGGVFCRIPVSLIAVCGGLLFWQLYGSFHT